MILGLNGYIGAGKDTVAEIIEEEFPDLDVVKVPIAWKVKEVGAASLGITVEELDKYKNSGRIYIDMSGDTTIDTHAITFREYIQQVGDEAHRALFHEDIWVDELPPELSGASDTLYILSDIRYQNEGMWAKRRRAKIWRIDDGKGKKFHHGSENWLDEAMIDRTIDNSAKDWELLRRQVIDAFKEDYGRYIRS